MCWSLLLSLLRCLLKIGVACAGVAFFVWLTHGGVTGWLLYAQELKPAQPAPGKAIRRGAVA